MIITVFRIMGTYKLREYQQETINNIVTELDIHNRVLVQLPTGGGKTIIFTEFAKTVKNLKVLILVHRVELLKQTLKNIPNAKKITAKTKSFTDSDNGVFIAMVETLNSRLKKDQNYITGIDLIITDEAHILCFEKIWDYFTGVKILGFTATPIINKLRTILIDEVEYTEPYTLSELYDNIIVGVSIQELIDLGYLVQDVNVVLDIDISGLKETSSNPDGYTNKSIDEVYNTHLSLETLLKGYEKYAVGKKTLVFNGTVKNNKLVNFMFLLNGYNSKMYDSVNNTTDEREEIVNWFTNTPDAILCNVGVFTTGFDVVDIEVIILNKATKSFGLFIQMVGRGSRITDKIYKDSFTVIDGGHNIERFGRWSANVDWRKLFFPQGRKLKRKRDLLNIWVCKSCGALNIMGETVCSECGKEKMLNDRKQKIGASGDLVIIDKVPLPNGNKIVKYAQSNGEGSSFAFRVLEIQIFNLFLHYGVTKEKYIKNRVAFANRVKEIFNPIYFKIIKSDLEGANKTYRKQLERIIEKINKYYED